MCNKLELKNRGPKPVGRGGRANFFFPRGFPASYDLQNEFACANTLALPTLFFFFKKMFIDEFRGFEVFQNEPKKLSLRNGTYGQTKKSDSAYASGESPVQTVLNLDTN